MSGTGLLSVRRWGASSAPSARFHSASESPHWPPSNGKPAAGEPRKSELLGFGPMLAPNRGAPIRCTIVRLHLSGTTRVIDRRVPNRFCQLRRDLTVRHARGRQQNDRRFGAAIHVSNVRRCSSVTVRARPAIATVVRRRNPKWEYPELIGRAPRGRLARTDQKPCCRE